MTHELQYDVVVVGSGGGALTGAWLAARAGLSTVMVEKTAWIGGTSAYSGGACWLPGSAVQQRAGIGDSREGGRLPAIAMPEGDPADHLAAGTWVQAETLPAFAEAIDVPAEALTATVERFNGFAESGVDQDFGRGDDEYDTFFAGGKGPNKALTPLDLPPFYAARFVLSDLGTKGGLVTDAAGRVLRDDGSAIAGLYAASNSSASVFGPVYPGPGAPLGSAMVFASLAVRDMLG